MTLTQRLAARRRFDRLSRPALELLVEKLTEARRAAEREARELRDQLEQARDHVEQRLLGRAFAHEADARHVGLMTEDARAKAKWHQAVADELRDAARDIAQHHEPRNDGSH